jgi:CarboxypepD_reg-like domain/TonB-dependent Receptor Plug Domain
MSNYKGRCLKFCQLVILFCFCAFAAQAQNKFTISGTVKDKASGEELIGAIVRVSEQSKVGVVTNAYGFYSLTLPEGNYTLLYSSIGYLPISQAIILNQNIKQDAQMQAQSLQMQEVEVTSVNKSENVMQAQMGLEKLDMKEVNKIPVLFGEKDILKTIQLLPGVKSAGDGNSGFFVRGGAADQNLILLDEAPVYNASHLLGFFSTFNSDAIKDVALYKGNAPAQYGGRLASVLDVKMNEGNDKKYHIKGGIGLIASRLCLEGPIKKENGSFIITARRTYADLFLKLSKDEQIKNNGLYFYDLNLKANYRMGKKDRLFLSGYFGRDKINLGSSFGIDWGNATGTLRWNHLINEKLFSNTSFIFSNYSYKISISSGATDFEILSRIRDFNFKEEFQYFPNPKNNIRIGLNSIFHTITPGQIKASATSSINPTKLQERYGWENALYFNNEWKALDRLNISYGVRFTSFSLMGKGDFYLFDKDGNTTDTLSYKNGKFVKSYFNPEPRITASFIINENNSIKAAYARNVQNLHLLSNSTSTSPTDSWISSTINVKPEIADQFSLGYFTNLKENKYEMSAELYYKNMQNQIDFKNGADVQANEKVEGELLYGIGRAYGLEFLLKKKAGKISGWIGYTLSRTERKIDGINKNNWYLARQDRTHDVSIVFIYDISKKWNVSATWVYSTGNAVTFPSGKYEVDGQVQFLYTERNGYRMPAYHRLDLGATWQLKQSEKFESSLNFSLYNAYGRQNAYTIEFRQSETDPSKTEAVQVSLFRFVPSITYNFRF